MRNKQLPNIDSNKNCSHGSNKKLRKTNWLHDEQKFNRKTNLRIDKIISGNETVVQKQDKNRNKKPHKKINTIGRYSHHLEKLNSN